MAVAGDPVAPRPRALVVVADSPWPTDRGKRLRLAATVRGVAQVTDVDLLLAADDDGRPVPVPDGLRLTLLRASVPVRGIPGALLRVPVRRVPWRIARQDWARARAGAPATPYDLAWFTTPDQALALRDVVRARRRVVDLDDVESEKADRFLAMTASGGPAGRVERLQRRIERRYWRRIEAGFMAGLDRVVVCSEDDRRFLGGRDVRVVPNCYPDPGPPPARAQGADPVLLLVGNFDYEPNIDAARWLVQQVLPEVLRVEPAAVVRLVGWAGRERLARLAGPAVDVVGGVPDVLPYLRSAAVAVAPVRYGGGTRIKLLEAFAAGVPAVSTTVGCEGLGVRDGVQLLVADGAEPFAAACVRLLSDPALAQRLATTARAHYDATGRPEVAEAAVAAVAADLLAPA